MQVKIPWVLMCIKFLLVLSAVMYVQTESTKNNKKRTNKDLLEAIFKLESNEDLFKISLLKRRQEFAEIIQIIQKMGSHEMKFLTIAILTQDIMEIIENSTALIENCMHNIPGYDLNDYIIADALFIMLESTTFLGDMIVHFPNYMDTILRGHKEWMKPLYWSFRFIHKMKHLLDESTISVIYSAKKRLG
ncbi:uncharacterized protein LOC122519748 [Polistes fuscatus]|uniref:uncharacterized protein LOC122519748 n=1 Tax=Polistes fuscatus TaxID=30207 RepID=UPI001CA7D48E|nr:uncharacterized protein LOC122519748 [Polistes fuscatus]